MYGILTYITVFFGVNIAILFLHQGALGWRFDRLSKTCGRAVFSVILPNFSTCRQSWDSHGICYIRLYHIQSRINTKPPLFMVACGETPIRHGTLVIIQSSWMTWVHVWWPQWVAILPIWLGDWLPMVKLGMWVPLTAPKNHQIVTAAHFQWGSKGVLQLQTHPYHVGHISPILCSLN